MSARNKDTNIVLPRAHGRPVVVDAKLVRRVTLSSYMSGVSCIELTNGRIEYVNATPEEIEWLVREKCMTEKELYESLGLDPAILVEHDNAVREIESLHFKLDCWKMGAAAMFIVTCVTVTAMLAP